MTNEKIIRRPWLLSPLSGFFKENPVRFKSVKDFVVDWHAPQAWNDLYGFCETNVRLRDTLTRIVPENMHGQVGLGNDAWIAQIAGENSRLALAESEVCADYINMENLRQDYFDQDKDNRLGRIRGRMKTIAEENTLNFLSRKAIIPKYGFPVDVVELDVRSTSNQKTGVSLQRDLSQAIAEYAPGGKWRRNKLEWESCGVKAIAGKECLCVIISMTTRAASGNGTRRLQRTTRRTEVPHFPSSARDPLFQETLAAAGRARRLYTTRPSSAVSMRRQKRARSWRTGDQGRPRSSGHPV